MKTNTIKTKRSSDDHIKFYSKRSVAEKLAETVNLSDCMLNLMIAGKKAGFNGKK